MPPRRKPTIAVEPAVATEVATTVATQRHNGRLVFVGIKSRGLYFQDTFKVAAQRFDLEGGEDFEIIELDDDATPEMRGYVWHHSEENPDDIRAAADAYNSTL